MRRFAIFAVGALTGGLTLALVAHFLGRWVHWLKPIAIRHDHRPEARGHHVGLSRVLAIVFAIAAAIAGYSVAKLQDLSAVRAQERQAALLQPDPRAGSPEVFTSSSVPELASGSYVCPHAAVFGTVTVIDRQPDGDYHVHIEEGGAFIVAEIIPEFPLDPPEVGDAVTAWGIVREDVEKGWWELHPLLGWRSGNVLSLGGGDAQDCD